MARLRAYPAAFVGAIKRRHDHAKILVIWVSSASLMLSLLSVSPVNANSNDKVMTTVSNITYLQVAGSPRHIAENISEKNGATPRKTVVYVSGKYLIALKEKNIVTTPCETLQAKLQ